MKINVLKPMSDYWREYLVQLRSIRHLTPTQLLCVSPKDTAIEFAIRLAYITYDDRALRRCPHCGHNVRLLRVVAQCIISLINLTRKPGFPLMSYWKSYYCNSRCATAFLENCGDTRIWLMYDNWKDKQR